MSMSSIGRQVVEVGERPRGPALQGVELMEREMARYVDTINFLERRIEEAEFQGEETLELVQANVRKGDEVPFEVMDAWLQGHGRYMHQLRYTPPTGPVRTAVLCIYLRMQRGMKFVPIAAN